jgi:hypothetical protein
MIILLDENLLSRKLKQSFLSRGYEVYNPRSALILLKKYLERKCLYSKCFEP